MTDSLPLEQKATKMMPPKNVLQKRNFRAKMRAVIEVNPADFLTNVHCPVLAIFGENDTSIPVDKSVFIY